MPKNESSRHSREQLKMLPVLMISVEGCFCGNNQGVVFLQIHVVAAIELSILER